MSRSRLLWFGFGFTTAYAYMSLSVLHDVKAQRFVLNRCWERVDALENRMSQMESSSPKPSSTPSSPSVSDKGEGQITFG
ncbi:uncharacterized protein LOC108347861 [Vigna angularis]|uniref:uncharacterized protein LOC108347861 n=1 Tax=Phaseolus angularis TaxID=3914 RepID=UPI00080A24E1|nr:uncharacterized protein LOC108347861 [Vigna angularis]